MRLISRELTNIHPSYVKRHGKQALVVSHTHRQLIRTLHRYVCSSDSERTSAYDSMRQRLSVDAGARFKLTKLEYVSSVPQDVCRTL